MFLSYFKAVNILLVTFRVKNIVSFCVKKLLHFALKSCYILRQKLLHFGLMLHFASKLVTFRVNVTFCVNCYILRRNRLSISSRLRQTANNNLFVPPDKVSPLLVVYCSLFLHINQQFHVILLSTRIVLSCFYLLIFCFKKLSTRI